jgi:hypothetical protein
MSDITYIEIRNDKKEILDYMYIGVIKYTNTYSLEIFKYLNTNTKLYSRENINHKKLITYAVWDDHIIDNIKKLIIDNPKSEVELELYSLINNIINWIYLKKELYKDHNIHVLCVTIHQKV